MCLAMPGKVVKITGDTAEVDFSGIKMNINIALVAGIKKGDYCLAHAGYAIEKVDKARAMETKKYLEELNAAENK